MDLKAPVPTGAFFFFWISVIIRNEGKTGNEFHVLTE